MPGTSTGPGANSIIFVFIVVLINMIGFGVIIPVMPDLIMGVTGEGRAFAARWGGILSTVYAIMQFIMGPILGALSDRFGRRPVILGSLAIYSLDFLLLAIAPTLGVLMLARIISGAFSATFSTANAYIADVSPPEKRAANFGLMGAAFGLGFIVGPLIGGLIGSAFGTRAPFFFVAGLGALNLIYGVFFLPETLKPENRRKFEWRRANAFGSFAQFSKYPIILPIALAIFLYQTGHWTFPSVWAYFAGEQYGWSAREIAYSLTFVGVTSAIVQGGLVRIAVKKLGEATAGILGMVVALATYPFYAFAPEPWMVYGLIALGALAGLTMPALEGVMSRTLPANSQGELQGAITAIMGLSMIIGPYVMTQTFAAFTEPGQPIYLGPILVSQAGAPIYLPGAPFILAAILTALALIPLVPALMRRTLPADNDKT